MHPSSNSDPVSPSTRWWTYVAEYDGLAGSTRLDMGLKDVAPIKALPYLVIIGTSYTSYRKDKLPDAAETERLNQASDPLVLSVLSLGHSIYAGTFTNDQEQVHFIYVPRLDGIRIAFSNEHAKRCPQGNEVYIEKHDPDWEQYLSFLYPNPATIEFYGYNAETNRSAR